MTGPLDGLCESPLMGATNTGPRTAQNFAAFRKESLE